MGEEAALPALDTTVNFNLQIQSETRQLRVSPIASATPFNLNLSTFHLPPPVPSN